MGSEMVYKRQSLLLIRRDEDLSVFGEERKGKKERAGSCSVPRVRELRLKCNKYIFLKTYSRYRMKVLFFAIMTRGAIAQPRSVPIYHSWFGGYHGVRKHDVWDQYFIDFANRLGLNLNIHQKLLSFLFAKHQQ